MKTDFSIGYLFISYLFFDLKRAFILKKLYKKKIIIIRQNKVTRAIDLFYSYKY